MPESTPMPAASWQPPRRIDALDFWLRSRALVALRGLRELCAPSARRWPAAEALVNAPVLARHRSALWTETLPIEFPLLAGKVHNLRVAARAFHALEVPAGEVFSFWRQLGRPVASRGFVVGRELRSGCVVPTVAGGICQFTNALASVAAMSGFDLVERHRHTRLPEALPGDGRVGEPGDKLDATVFWNYLDLKLRAPHAWRLEVTLTASELVLTVRGHGAAAGVRPVSAPLGQEPHTAPLRRASLPAARDARRERSTAGPTPPLRNCLSCGETSCFRHQPPPPALPQARTAWLLDAWTPEFARALSQQAGEAVDAFVPTPVRLAFWRAGGAAWHLPVVTSRERWGSLRRALWQRCWARSEGGRRQASLIDGARWLAQSHARRLRPEHTQLVVDQSLLPHLQLMGVLAGRRVQVLAHGLPMAQVHARLDAAARRWPQAANLRDFRADDTLVQAELQALAAADCISTPHRALARVLPGITTARIDLLPWAGSSLTPQPRPEPDPGPAPTRAGHEQPADAPWLVFPASSLARKGALELAEALQDLPRSIRPRLRVLGSPPDLPRLWGALEVHYVDWRGNWLDGAHAVVLPAHVEHAPRALLRALAAGVPVIATAACGLGERPGVHTVVEGDVAGLRAALQQVLGAVTRAGPV